MRIKNIVVGSLEANCFIVSDEKTSDAMIIDPGDEPERIIEYVRKENLHVKYIVCTHGHFDHVGAVGDTKETTGAKVFIHKDELEIYSRANDQAAFFGFEVHQLPEPDKFLEEGDTLEIGNLKFEILHTPGHSPGGICLYGEGVVFTGDTLFAGSVGRTDFYGGDSAKLKKSFMRLMSLPPETKVYSGHGTSSTIRDEKEGNFFMGEVMN